MNNSFLTLVNWLLLLCCYLNISNVRPEKINEMFNWPIWEHFHFFFAMCSKNTFFTLTVKWAWLGTCALRWLQVVDHYISGKMAALSRSAVDHCRPKWKIVLIRRRIHGPFPPQWCLAMYLFEKGKRNSRSKSIHIVSLVQRARACDDHDEPYCNNRRDLMMY